MPWWAWAIAVLLAISVGAVVTSFIQDNSRDATTSSPSPGVGCPEASADWLSQVQLAFHRRDQNKSITKSGYVEIVTAEGAAYYVGLSVEGADGPVVFSATNPPTSKAVGVLAAANHEAERLSDFGPPDGSPVNERLRDAEGVAQAEACLS